MAETTAPSDFKYLRYALVFLGASLVLSSLGSFVGINSVTGIITALPPLIASAIEGNDYAKRHGARPAGVPAWRMTLAMTGIGLGVNILLFGLTLAAVQGGGGDPMTVVKSMLPMAALITVAQLGFNRLGLRVAPQSAGA